MIAIILVFAFMRPSLISIASVVISHGLIFTVALKTEDRAFYG
jgi:hypothetical protein